jgi:hypothetical protein
LIPEPRQQQGIVTKTGVEFFIACQHGLLAVASLAHIVKVCEEGPAPVFVVEADKYMTSRLNKFTYTANSGRTIVRVVKHPKRDNKIEGFVWRVRKQIRNLEIGRQAERPSDLHGTFDRYRIEIYSSD